MKKILLSVYPKYCELIFSGKKTIEVRKSAPKEVPFKAYIYCTKAGEKFVHGGIGEKQFLFFNPDTKEYKFDYAFELICCKNKYSKDNFLSGKVIGEFICDKIDCYPYGDMSFPALAYDGTPTICECESGYDITCGDLEKTCLDYEDLENYGESKTLYGWHITNLKIYNKPRGLGEFWSIKCMSKNGSCSDCKAKPVCVNYLTRAPQSWQYVEELQ